jgi:hypothetical protein
LSARARFLGVCMTMARDRSLGCLGRVARVPVFGRSAPRGAFVLDEDLRRSGLLCQIRFLALLDTRLDFGRLCHDVPRADLRGSASTWLASWMLGVCAVMARALPMSGCVQLPRCAKPGFLPCSTRVLMLGVFAVMARPFLMPTCVQLPRATGMGLFHSLAQSLLMLCSAAWLRARTVDS